jgi:hypothetical protein
MHSLLAPKELVHVLRSLCLQRGQSNPEELTLRQMAKDAVDILWEGQAGHQHVMTIGNAGSHHRGECSWWAQGHRCLEQIQVWQQWVQHCHLSSDSEVPECVTFADGILSVRVEGGQQLLRMAMDNGNFLETKKMSHPRWSLKSRNSHNMLKKSQKTDLGRPARSQNVKHGTAFQEFSK